MADADAPVRMRGRALQRARAELFAANRWCVTCQAKGLEIDATIRAHIVPLAEGGTDDVDNTEGLCLDCWVARKEAEAARGLAVPSLQRAFTKASAPREGRTGQFSVRRKKKAARIP